MSLRCSDGSAFAATLVLDRDEDVTGGPFRVFSTLEDGWHVAG